MAAWPSPQYDREDVFSHCPEIDSLRAIAMTAVVAMHCQIFPMGWAGVWLFFVISGYVVTLSIARKRDAAGSSTGFAIFMRQRFGRIVPPYFAYVLAGIVFAWITSGDRPWATIASLLGFYHNVAMIGGHGGWTSWPVEHLWTISVEMQFYLIYGVVAYFAPLHITKAMLWCFIVLAPVARFLTAQALSGADPEHIAYFIYASPILQFDIFAMGCLLALSRLTRPVETVAAPLTAIGATALTLYMGAYVAINAIVRDRAGLDIIRDIVSGILYGEGREVFLYSALGLASLALVAQTASRNRLVQPFTGLRPLQHIGKISYGAYIYHSIAIWLTYWLAKMALGHTGDMAVPQRIAFFAVALTITLAMAEISWRYLERPAMGWVRRLGLGERQQEKVLSS